MILRALGREKKLPVKTPEDFFVLPKTGSFWGLKEWTLNGFRIESSFSFPAGIVSFFEPSLSSIKLGPYQL